MTDHEAELAAYLRALPAPNRKWCRDQLRRLVDAMPAPDRRHASAELERVRHDNFARAVTALHDAINAIPGDEP